MYTLRKFLPMLIAVVVLVGFAILLYNSQTQTEDPDEFKVAASIFPIYDLTRQVAGNKMQVELLLPAGASEHDYEPTLQDKQRLQGVDQLFVVGLDLDNWVLGLLDDQQSIDIVDLSTSPGLQLKAISDSAESFAGEESLDPHYWLSIANAQALVGHIKDSLVALDPVNASYYEENASNLHISLDTLKNENSDKLSELSSRELITFHEAFSYFAADYGLEVVATIEPYPGQEPSLEYMSELGRIIETHEVDVIFSEPQLSDQLVQAIKSDYDLELYTLDPLGGLQGRNTYQELIRYNVDTIYSALKF